MQGIQQNKSLVCTNGVHFYRQGIWLRNRSQQGRGRAVISCCLPCVHLTLCRPWYWLVCYLVWYQGEDSRLRGLSGSSEWDIYRAGQRSLDWRHQRCLWGTLGSCPVASKQGRCRTQYSKSRRTFSCLPAYPFFARSISSGLIWLVYIFFMATIYPTWSTYS